MDKLAIIWWVIRGAEKSGPYTAGDLESKVRAGDLAESDKIWKEGLGAPIPITIVVRARQDKLTRAIAFTGLAVLAVLLVSWGLALYAREGNSLFFFTQIIPPVITFLVVLILLIFAAVVFLDRRDKRGSLRKKFSARIGFEYVDGYSKAEGFDITVGSVIASGGDARWPYSGLLRGARGGYSFQAVDYGFGSGRTKNIATVICIYLKCKNINKFSIVDKKLLYNFEKANKSLLDRRSEYLSKNNLIAVNKNDSKTPFFPEVFMRFFASKEDTNVECFEDRILVYRLDEVLVGDDYIEWLDYATALADKLTLPVNESGQQA